jgi:putative sterol carrier protein
MKVALAVILAASVVGSAAAAANEKQSSTPQQVFDAMRDAFQVDKAKGVHVRYQFEISGPAGGFWRVEVDDGKCKINKGKIDNPDVTFVASDKDWVALSNGRLNGTWAFITGRLKIRGPQELARKLDEMFP